jgi:hypothetical protein
VQGGGELGERRGGPEVAAGVVGAPAEAAADGVGVQEDPPSGLSTAEPPVAIVGTAASSG